MSLKDLIVQHLKSKYPEIIHKGALGKIAVNEWNFENENLGRRCRELENEGTIKKFEDDKKRAMYQYVSLGVIGVSDGKGTCSEISTGGRIVSEKDKLKYL